MRPLHYNNDSARLRERADLADCFVPLRRAPRRPGGRIGALTFDLYPWAGSGGCSLAGAARSAPRALVVTRDLRLRWFVRQRLAAAGFEVRSLDDGLYALMLAHRDPPDVIIVGAVDHGLDTAHVLRHLRKDDRTARVPVLVVEACAAGGWRVARPSAAMVLR